MGRCSSVASLLLLAATIDLSNDKTLLAMNIRPVIAQEVEFKPRWDGVEKPRRAKKTEQRQDTPAISETPVIYSFDRYSKQLREICNLLDRDHRRERVGKAAFDEVRDGVSCKSCKAFLREVIEQCHYRRKISPTPTREVATPSGGSVTTVPTVAAETPAAARYPLTELLDRTSELSSDLYQRDAGEGEVLESVKYFVDLLMKQKDLTEGEREYYGIFTTYLLSAWDGRPNSPLVGVEPSKQEVRSLFE